MNFFYLPINIDFNCILYVIPIMGTMCTDNKILVGYLCVKKITRCMYIVQQLLEHFDN